VLGVVAVAVAALALVLLWRAHHRLRRARAGADFTPEEITRQIADSGLDPPAFEEDGSILGASVLVVNQRPKVLEVVTEYGVYGWSGARLGAVRQVGQSKAKQAARALTAFDQFFTHHLEIVDAAGDVVLRLVRPRKVLYTRVHVSGPTGPIGTIRQRNVFGRIRFVLEAVSGHVHGYLRAENLRAWDFDLVDAVERPFGSIVKTWEGWGRTAFTRADCYVVRIDEPLPTPMRELAVAAALTVDLALKQDARGVL
jgi:hypothetical protein